MSKRVSKKECWFRGNNFTAEDEIYVGVDVHKRHYHVAIWHNGRIGCIYSMSSDNKKLLRDVQFNADTINVPLRILHTKETYHKRQRIAGEWIEKDQEQSWWWATTIPEKQLSTPHLWKAGHQRWDIENCNFNTLGRDWALNHCFRHDPIAIVNFVLTLFIAFVLVQSFYYRNLKQSMRGLFRTLISITEELYAGLYNIQLQNAFAVYAPNPPP